MDNVKNLGKYALKGNTPWNKGKRGLQVSWNKGKKMSMEFRNKIRKSLLGCKRHIVPHTEATKLKISFAKKGQKSPNKGKHLSLEVRRKLSLSHGGNGILGLHLHRRSIVQREDYKQWKKLVFERDGYKCQVCNIVGTYLEAHHIKSFSHYPELRLDIDNGITLCKKCHSLTDNYKGKAKQK